VRASSIELITTPIEVEDVPARPEELLRSPAAGGDPDRQLDNEDAEEDEVERVEQVAVAALEVLVGLRAEHRGVEHDHREDGRREPVGFGDARAALGEGGTPGAVAHGGGIVSERERVRHRPAVQRGQQVVHREVRHALAGGVGGGAEVGEDQEVGRL